MDDISKGAITSYTFTSVSSGYYHTIYATFEATQAEPPDSLFTTATAGEHSKIKPLRQVKLAHGTIQEFTITPDSGYYIAELIIDGVKQSSPQKLTHLQT